jgi:hypothetical protein
MKPDGSGERILTSGFHNEGPTWAPNGRVIMFFRQPAGAGGPQLYSIDLTGYNEQQMRRPATRPTRPGRRFWSELQRSRANVLNRTRPDFAASKCRISCF